MRRILLFLFILSTHICLSAQQEWTPPKSDRLVNDYSGILTSSEKAYLEHRLVEFADTTSNQIVVVITPTLHGDEVKAVGQRIGQQWGVGQAQYNNGLVILIKSKTTEEPTGDVAILTGYGLEGAFPDVFCKRIIDDRMIPALRQGDYYGAINEALEVILPVAAGEYNYAQYRKDETTSLLVGLLVSFGVFGLFLFLLIRYAKKHPDQFNNRSIGGGHSGGWYGGSWGGGRSSGSFSGFGGFGGGSFGGGGASGRF